MEELRQGGAVFLSSLADYGCLTVRQCVEAGLGSAQMIRRHTRVLQSGGLVQCVPWQLDGTKGRPENLLLPTRKGLRVAGLAKAEPLGSELFAHQYHVNRCRVLFSKLEEKGVGFAFTHGWRAARCMGSNIVPDGVFVLRSDILKKSLLFFLEMDMGTEPLSGGGSDLRGKILRYRNLMLEGGYTRLASGDAVFHGFRVLFVVLGVKRLEGVARLCAGLPACPFVWSTELESIAKKGAGSRVWIKEGDQRNLRSVLGSLADER